MNGVKRCDELRVERKRISLNKRQRVMRLGIYVYPDNFESCPAVTYTRATGTAEEIEQSRFLDWRVIASGPYRVLVNGLWHGHIMPRISQGRNPHV